MAKKYLTLEEAAEKLGISAQELLRARENGDLRGFADRGSWKFREADVEEFGRSREADSDPDIPMLSGDSVLEGEGQDLTSSDSDVRLAVDESLLPSGDMGESTSDVRLTGDSGPGLESSDSEVRLVGSDSDSDVRMSDSDSDVRLSDDSDSDVELVADSDSDVKLLDDGSDSDVQLIDSLAATDGDVILSGETDSLEMEVLGEEEAKPDDSSMIIGGSGLLPDGSGMLVDESGTLGEGSDTFEDSDSDVVLDPQDPGSDITLESPASSASVLDDDSGITLETADSGVLMGADDSGISLESIDSGLVLDEDSGISLDVGDSGISLDVADSGIALAGDDDSGIALDSVDQTMPMTPSMGQLPSDGLETTHMETADALDAASTSSEFELAGLGDDDDDVGMDTSVLLFEDDEEEGDTAESVPIGSSSGAAAAAGAAALAGSDEMDFGDEFDDDDELEMDDDDDFDDDVFDAADDDFDDDFDAGESQVEFAGAAAVARPAVEHDWGVGWLITLSLGSVLMIMCCLLSFDLVRSMWAWNEPTPISNMLLDTVGKMFTPTST